MMVYISSLSIYSVCWAGIQTDILATTNTGWAEKVKISHIPRCMSFSIHGLKTLLSLSLFISNLNSQIKASFLNELLLNLSPSCITRHFGFFGGGGIFYHVHPSSLPPWYCRICIAVKDAVPSLKAIQIWTLFMMNFQFKLEFLFHTLQCFDTTPNWFQSSLWNKKKNPTSCPHRANSSHIQFAIIQIYRRNVVRAKKNSRDWTFWNRQAQLKIK